MAGNVVAASWMDEESLPRVALWVITGTVCVVFVVWRAESSHPGTGSTAMVCVCVMAGVELPARARALAVLFPPVFCFFCVFVLPFAFFPCHPFFLCSCVE
ncbi:trans-sialidase [Trypanosoma cruzi]|nr:trans-sialidase [Trypanosoma cruzi]